MTPLVHNMFTSAHYECLILSTHPWYCCCCAPGTFALVVVVQLALVCCAGVTRTGIVVLPLALSTAGCMLK